MCAKFGSNVSQNFRDGNTNNDHYKCVVRLILFTLNKINCLLQRRLYFHLISINWLIKYFKLERQYKWCLFDIQISLIITTLCLVLLKSILISLLQILLMLKEYKWPQYILDSAAGQREFEFLFNLPTVDHKYIWYKLIND